MQRSDPDKCYTLEDFVACKQSDEITYRNFSIFEKSHGMEILDHSLISDYLDELSMYTVELELSNREMARYKYAPDLLAYDVYGSVQYDFIILMLNDMIDPKEFNRRKVRMLSRGALEELLGSIYTSEESYISTTRDQNGLVDTLG